jgi:ATP-binding cassette subfamily G (WHITE) protein 2 (SNQ2)
LDKVLFTFLMHLFDQFLYHMFSVFGLNGVRNTIVGDENFRGVSGGEKKRVSIAEMLSARGRVGCWDK